MPLLLKPLKCQEVHLEWLQHEESLGCSRAAQFLITNGCSLDERNFQVSDS